MGAMKILLIRLSSIGDIVLTTPLIRTIKKLYPDSEISLIVKKEYQELFKYNVENGTLIILLNYINTEKFDIIFDLHNNIKSNLIKFFSNAELKITYNKDILERRLLVFNSFIRRKLIKISPINPPRSLRYLGTESGATTLKIMKYDDLKNIVHTIDRYFYAAKDILGDHNISHKLEIEISDKEKDFSSKLLQENDILIGFNPGGKNLTKRWPAEKYIELGKKIIEDLKAKIIIFGDKNDDEVAEDIKKNIGDKNVINVAGKTNLLELSSLINKCKLFITGDTGPMHIANAFDVPVIAIFGPTVVEFGFYPTGVNDVVLCLDLYCRPCSLHGGKKCPILTFDCMNKINADDVFKIVYEKLRGNS